MYSVLKSRIHWSFSSNSGSVSKSHAIASTPSRRDRRSSLSCRPAARGGPNLAPSARWQLVALDLVEREVTVSGVLPRHAEHALADDVAGHLGASAAEAAALAGEGLVGVAR